MNDSSTGGGTPPSKLVHDLNGQLGALRLELYSLRGAVEELAEATEPQQRAELGKEVEDILNNATAVCRNATSTLGHLGERLRPAS